MDGFRGESEDRYSVLLSSSFGSEYQSSRQSNPSSIAVEIVASGLQVVYPSVTDNRTGMTREGVTKYGRSATNHVECIPPSFRNGVFCGKLRVVKKQSNLSWLKPEAEKKVTKPTGPDLVRLKPTKVERGARLKQKEVGLDDAVVEDTPPSKIKGMTPKENHDVEGSSKIRTRFGSVAREIKVTHPRPDVEESTQKCTRYGSVARGIKAKHPRSRKHRDVDVGEIRETAYRGSLDSAPSVNPSVEPELANVAEEDEDEDLDSLFKSAQDLLKAATSGTSGSGLGSTSQSQFSPEEVSEAKTALRMALLQNFKAVAHPLGLQISRRPWTY
ncbi:hypothetical protein RHSIM_Rhsim04G0141300 [Rhododendron simsii]|uniref:Uncharacterized protein n=1 Tax=Rhododendron simsii TaxID=118357 RepID=A0A834HAY2_RHOSS|nr:hypothetical protein RHSIM_Rhsim04G0141300 [Rhododendron simsii]